MEVPKARGTGRSGPRRRTGCLTCRARKVRCDEEKPNCANCIRLRLRCVYKTIVPGIAPRQRSERSSVSVDSATTTPFPPSHPDENFFNTVLRADAQRQRQQQQNNVTNSLRPMNGEPASYGPEFQGPFDMLGFIGEITSELQQKHLDLTNGVSDLRNPTPPAVTIAHGHGPAFNNQRQQALGPERSPLQNGLSAIAGSDHHSERFDSEPPVSSPWPEPRATYEEQLVMHFLDIESPPTIFGPVNMEWKYVRPEIVANSRGFDSLLSAIYCYADIHKAMMEGERWKLAPMYHRLASSKIQSCISGDVDDFTLKRVFATVFLLMLSELLTSLELCRPGTSLLHSAYLLLQRFHSQTKSWVGFGYLMVSWISLLDVKSLIAGRDGDPLIELGHLSDPMTEGNGQRFDRLPSGYAGCKEEEVDDLFAKPGYLVYEAIVGPAFRFFTKAQQVIRRIVCLDLHHRSRGTLSDEFEVLQIAHKVGADLETLWNCRPRVLDVYDRPEELFDTLSQPVALEVCRTFRQYVANFLANFVYLHRVAFAIYPRTDRVNGAVDQIIQLATVESAGTKHLPVSFFWPLFVAGLEGSLDQRLWIVQEMQQMASWTGETTWRHPSAGKALLLLEEMTRRQDASRTWADSRFVRQELFADFFVMI
ncbi:hypothetical protein ASPWEDRAFT_449388 [Aspergillus wentii DTO 134E9]|uniref:Zn(2)-C6 fungal-type domain-containing protein n=1 Tax=Aspergillus wentii DTO 134E9 TaxID=1073089 RepID=A0A1L9RR17_ASPWE|nr:uncharacterized protein ASPWEDRAFT_449388 [Aspergillus wentii DTO 134E9]OJJ37342.1 hypothetical protein ASPWEDRAFT_449388 [Aspergillus wentii DTO 134E9]